MEIDKEFEELLRKIANKIKGNNEENSVFPEKTDEHLWTLVPKMKELVPHPKSTEKVINEKYTDQQIFDQLRAYFDSPVIDETKLKDDIDSFKNTFPTNLTEEEGKKLIQNKFNELVGWNDTKYMYSNFWSKFGSCQYTQMPFLVEGNTNAFGSKLHLSGAIYNQLHSFKNWYEDYCKRKELSNTIFTSPFNNMDEMEEELSVKKIGEAARNFYLDKTKNFDERVKVFSKYGKSQSYIWHPSDKNLNKIFEMYTEDTERYITVETYRIVEWWVECLAHKRTEISFVENRFHPKLSSEKRNYEVNQKSCDRLYKYYMEKLFIEEIGSFEIDW